MYTLNNTTLALLVIISCVFVGLAMRPSRQTQIIRAHNDLVNKTREFQAWDAKLASRRHRPSSYDEDMLIQATIAMQEAEAKVHYLSG